ncbi:hypothetical protein AMS62_05610 [Bacillus sp. FJAT-18019]|nr:hypothetical protein AMS62_05610 [Bacillus sp. FJAT-18019]
MFKNRRKRILSGISRFASLSIVLLLASMPTALAKSSNLANSENDGLTETTTLMIIDTSYSMRVSKADITLREILGIYHELTAPSSRMGYIAYNDSISGEQALLANSIANHESMLQSLQDIRYTGFSDMPLGLDRGMDRVLELRQENPAKIRLLLLSDGGLDYRGGDAGGAGQARLNELLDQAKKQAIPIDAIAIHPAGTTERERLERLAADTDGMYVEATRPGEAATAVRQILAASHATSAFSPALLLWIGAAAVVLAGTIAFIMTRPRRAISGRMEGLFLRTASGSNPPMKNWMLSHVSPHETLTLQHLFHQLDVHEPLPEAARIRFRSGRGNRLIVSSSSRCVIMKNGRIMPRDRKIVLHDGEQIYITFEDGRTELVLTYKAHRTSPGRRRIEVPAVPMNIPEETTSKPA